MENFAQEKRDLDILERYAAMCGGRDHVTPELLRLHKRAEHALAMQGGGRLGRTDMALLAAICGCVRHPSEPPEETDPALAITGEADRPQPTVRPRKPKETAAAA